MKMLYDHESDMFDYASAQEKDSYLLGFGFATSESLLTRRCTVDPAEREYQTQYDMDPHFWRGVVEHAGNIYTTPNKCYANPHLVLRASEEVLARFRQFVEFSVPLANHSGAFEPIRVGSWHRLHLLGETAKVVVHLLYDESRVQRQDWTARVNEVFRWEPKKWSAHLSDADRQFPTYPPRQRKRTMDG